MKRYPHFLALLLAGAMVLIGTGQSWAIGTAADTTISNTASVQYTINGSTSTKDSNTETFEVDRKIRMVVTNDGNATVVAGNNDYVLPFTVTNESNTQGGVTDWFRLTITGGTDDIDMNNVRLYADNNGDGLLDGGDTLLFTGLANDAYVSIGNTSGSNSSKYLIVADCPAVGTTVPSTANPGITADYNLVATAWNNNNFAAGQLAADGNGNDPALSEVVYADPNGTTAGDAPNPNGFHSAEGTYSTLATIGVAKLESGATASGYHIPGDVVTYDITVTNGDPTYPATSVIVTDGVPAGTTYSEFTACTGTKEWRLTSTGNWTSTDPSNNNNDVNAIRCTIANIAVGANSVVSFKVTISMTP